MTIHYPIATKDINTSIEFYEEVLERHIVAHDYLIGFKWCDAIKNAYLYYNLGATLCVFLFDIENNQARDEADNHLWVITGDLPNMYLDTESVKSLKDVLDVYADLSEDWADAILAKRSVEDCFPFDEKPSIKLAKLLKKRVDFIRNTLIDNVVNIELNNSYS